MTAYYPIVELSKASPEKNILVTAGTSTAGNAALNIGKMFGANKYLEILKLINLWMCYERKII